MKQDNRGYSLVELIVIIAIVGILAGLSMVSIASVPQGQVKACTKELVYQLEHTRTNSLGYEGASLTLTMDADGVHTKCSVTKKGVTTDETKTVGKAGIEIYYKIDGGALTLLEDDALTLTYDRSSGAFKYPKLTVGGSESTLDKYCTDIIIKKGSYQRQISLIPLTGKLVQK